jgi:hypothetical protein
LQSPRPTKGNFAWHIILHQIRSGEARDQNTDTAARSFGNWQTVSHSLSSPSSCNRRAFLSLVSVAWSLCAEVRGKQSGGFALLGRDGIRGRHHRPTTPTNA